MTIGQMDKENEGSRWDRLSERQRGLVRGLFTFAKAAVDKLAQQAPPATYSIVATPWAMANLMRPATLWTWSLSMMRSRWVSTVRTPMPRSAAISRLLL